MSSQATPSAETRINTSTEFTTFFPVSTPLADGGWVVTWSSYQQDSSDWGVYQQRYAADGDTIGSETKVNKYTADDQLGSTTTALAGGGWVVTWNSDGQDGSGLGIFQQRFDDHGARVGAETQVNTYTTGAQQGSSTAALANGGWVVTWSSYDQDSSQNCVYQQRYKANGNTAGTETLVNTNTNSDRSESSVVALVRGGWVVSWTSTGQDGDDPTKTGIYQQRFGANGQKLGSETLVNTYTTNSQMASATAALADGGWVVTWTSRYQDDADATGVYQQRYDIEGDRVGGEIRINTYTTSYQSGTSIAALADGGWVVVWSSNDQDGSGVGVYEQRYDANGTAVGSETLVNTTTQGPQYPSSVIAFADGGWEVTWTSSETVGGHTDVYQRHFASDINGSGRADQLTGTSWDETIIGRRGNDRLDGKGGNDILIGGFGNDIYVVNSSRDDVQELKNQGTDKVLASVSFSLASDPWVENLTLTGNRNINATGNGLDNILTGNSGGNTINGLAGADRLDGGKGNDVLTGGTDSDRFVFKTGYGRDSITDFDAKGGDHDRLDLSGLKSIEGFADLKADHMVQHGTSVVIDGTNGDTITLEQVKLGDLGAGDFIF